MRVALQHHHHSLTTLCAPRLRYKSLKTGERLGYAILVFGNDGEAAAAIERLHGTRVRDDFLLRLVLSAVDQKPGGGAAESAAAAMAAVVRVAGADPPLRALLVPHTKEYLMARLARATAAASAGAAGTAGTAGTAGAPLSHITTHAEVLDRLLEVAAQHGHGGGGLRLRERRAQGQLVPQCLIDPVLAELRALEWPSKSHRATRSSWAR